MTTQTETQPAQTYYSYEITRYVIDRCGETKPTWTEVTSDNAEHWYSLDDDKSTGVYYPIGEPSAVLGETGFNSARLSCEKLEIGEPEELTGIAPAESGEWDHYHMPDRDGYPGGQPGYFEQTRYAYSMSAFKCCPPKKYIDMTTNMCMQFVTTSEKYTGGDFGSGAISCDVVGDAGDNPESVCDHHTAGCIPYCPSAYVGSIGGLLKLSCDVNAQDDAVAYTEHKVPFAHPSSTECGGCPWPSDVLDKLTDEESESESMQMSETFDITTTSTETAASTHPQSHCPAPFNPDGELTFTGISVTSYGYEPHIERAINFHFDDNEWLPFSPDGTELLWKDLSRIKAKFPILGHAGQGSPYATALWHDVRSVSTTKSTTSQKIETVTISVSPPKQVGLETAWYDKTYHGQVGLVEDWEHTFDPFNMENQCEVPPTWTKTADYVSPGFNFFGHYEELIAMPSCPHPKDIIEEGLVDPDLRYTNFIAYDTEDTGPLEVTPAETGQRTIREFITSQIPPGAYWDYITVTDCDNVQTTKDPEWGQLDDPLNYCGTTFTSGSAWKSFQLRLRKVNCPVECMCNPPPPPPHCPGNPDCGECPGSPGCCEPCSGGSSIQSANCCSDPHVTTFFGEKFDM
jgi:hypothetical protein